MGLSELLPPELISLREEAKKVRDPACADETLAYILSLCVHNSYERILEIGAAEGLTACAMLSVCGADYTGIELDPARAARARENVCAFGFSARARLLEGDAGEILPMLGGRYGLIFLDGPKAAYRRYLPDCKRLLAEGGVLLSDDVLLFGWTFGEPPKKRRMLAVHIREYLEALQSDPDFSTEILELGEGLAVSVKKPKRGETDV